MKIGLLSQLTSAWFNCETETVLLFTICKAVENVKRCIIMQDRNRSTESLRAWYFTPLFANSLDRVGSSFSSFLCHGCLQSEKL